MKKSIPVALNLIILFSLPFSLKAEIKLPALISSNMVLQRNTSVTIWGWAEAKEKITLEASWFDEEIKFEANSAGSWKINLETTNSKYPQSIHLKSKSSDIVLENILFGEVWLCSGQSNMEQPMKGWEGEPVYGSAMAIAKSTNPNLRLFTVHRIASKTPLDDVQGYDAWQQAKPDNVREFSAVAYFFAEQLQEFLDCPVGVIQSVWDGSSIQPWISKEVLGEFQKVDIENTDLSTRTNYIPTALYNSMIHPLLNYAIKGALWYQGESNRRNPEEYRKIFPAMVQDWRTRWGLGDFPFYYAQIAPFTYGDNETLDPAINTAHIREVQLQCLNLIPNSGIAITMDIGAPECIHPPHKKEVADRLLFNALNQTYGIRGIDYASPVYDTLEKRDGGIVLKFKNAENGLFTYDKLSDFEIAGADKVFYPATARIGRRGESYIKTNEIFVQSNEVPTPVAVRYAWRNFVTGTLFDTNFLPASSFRTDTWDDAVRVENVE